MNLSNQKSRFLFATLGVITLFAFILLANNFNAPAVAEAQSNQLPTISNLQQWDGATSISEGWIIRYPSVAFSASINGPDNLLVFLQVELRRFEEPFTGNDDGGILTVVGTTTPDFVTRISRTGLIDGKYHWRARVVDDKGYASDWQEFGAAGNVDFEILTNFRSPTLSFPQTGLYANDGIDPNTGDTSTVFTFRVVYADADNNPPDFVRVCINGPVDERHALHEFPCLNSVRGTYSLDYTGGQEVSLLPISLPWAGTYTYYFEASDGTHTTRLPETGGLPLIVSSAQKVPVIIVPGIMGSKLNRTSDGREVWPNIDLMKSSDSDDYLNELKLNLFGQDSSNSILPSDVIRQEKIFTPLITYTYLQNLIESFTRDGYKEGENLFVAPYDWRLDINSEIGRLNTKIRQAILNSPTGKVNIIAHSMGGLLVKTYLNQLQDTSFVDKIILVASPQLGAPKTFMALNYGDNIGFEFLKLDILNSDRVKEITQNMPGVYELLPSRRYIQVNGGYIWDFRNNQAKILDFDQTNQLMLENPTDHRNGFILDLADKFHSAEDQLHPAFDNMPINAPQVYNIVGCQNPATITGFRLYDNNKIDITATNGDGTVPLSSAMNLANDYQNYFVRYDQTGINHTGLVTNNEAVDLITDIVRGETPDLPQGISTSPSSCFGPFQINRYLTTLLVGTYSPVVLHAYDSQNRHTGPLPNGDIELGIPGSSYERIGENSFVFVPAGDTYRFVADGIAQGTFDMKVRSFRGSELDQTITYLNVPLASASTTAELTLTDPQTAPNLNLDVDGNGVSDTSIQPTAILDATDSADITPPLIVISSPTSTDYLRSQTVPINVAVTDTESGVALTEIKLAGIIIASSTIDLFFEKLGDHQLAVHTVDRAGNPANAAVAFRVIATLESTISDIERAYSLGWIDNQGVKNSLIKKLKEGRENRIKAFLNELEAQHNKHINNQAYNLLKEDIKWIVEH